jgi:hypothetical protein
MALVQNCRNVDAATGGFGGASTSSRMSRERRRVDTGQTQLFFDPATDSGGRGGVVRAGGAQEKRRRIGLYTEMGGTLNV